MTASTTMPDHDANPPSPAPEPLPEGEEAPPAGTRTMAIVRWGLVVLMALAAIGAWTHHARQGGHVHSASATLYRCPMHPAVIQSNPGACPICGMDLVRAPGPGSPAKSAAPVVASAPTSASGKYWCPMHPEIASDDPDATCAKCGGMKLLPRDAGPQASGSVPGLAPIELSTERRQLIGLRTAKAARRKLAQELRAVGFVSTNERKVAIVTARASGWIAELKVAQSGQRVRPGDVLLTLDSSEVTAAQQAYAQNVRWKQNLVAGPNANNPAAQNVDRESLRRLRLYGMAQVDIDTVATTGEPLPVVPVRAPITGWVARKSVLPGQYVAAGTELYQLADLTTVWVVAELLEQDAARVRVGQRAALTLAVDPGARFIGRVDFLYPAVNPESRTLQARIEFKNPDLKLRPGAYGEVVIETGGAEALLIPADAVVDTGELRYVFLARGEGIFEPRVVQTGKTGGGQVEIVAGLQAGDEVVTTANFFADAESRLRAGIEGQAGGDAAVAH